MIRVRIFSRKYFALPLFASHGNVLEIAPVQVRNKLQVRQNPVNSDLDVSFLFQAPLYASFMKVYVIMSLRHRMESGTPHIPCYVTAEEKSYLNSKTKQNRRVIIYVLVKLLTYSKVF